MPAKKEGKVGCEKMIKDAEIWRLGVEVEDFCFLYRTEGRVLTNCPRHREKIILCGVPFAMA